MKNLISLLALSSLISIQSFAFTADSHEATTEAMLAREQFNYTPEVTVQNIEGKSRCRGGRLSYTTTLNQSNEPYQVHAKIYIPEQDSSVENEKRQIVFVLPTIKGGQRLAGLVDRYTAYSFCNRKFISVLIENDFTGLSSGAPLAISENELSIRRVVATLKGGVQVGIRNLNVDPNKVALFGASLGGILGTTAYGLMDEITAGSFIVAGGDLPHILTNSDQKPIIGLKEQAMAQYNLETEQQYQEFLKEYLKFDPLTFANFIDTEDIKLYLSKKDKAVPTVDQLKLYNELGQPETRFYHSTGHAFTIFRVLVFSRQKKHMAQWFNDRFEAQ